ncbi:hypothetical protein BS78_K154100 [Paspalum vaginatum]|uniref:Knottin scorpion toxin-like domain-containing protein n=1 Tax=Paspalum vaginatum TaxID=158149 RepID=A0A9W7XBD5_9POAL|nr:hypothetical protein BS78_K154100 [Paspalum vaginatum]
MVHMVNLSAVLLLVLLLLIAIATAAGGRIHAESALFLCNGHLSGSYKGLCFGLINDKDCKRACLDESSGNTNGECSFFQCWCGQNRCTTSETVAAAAAAASAPIPA